jgi:D-3-phosphoglycerate dehydrogenase
MRIIVCDSIAQEGIKILKEKFQVDEKIGIQPAELESIINSYDAVMVRSETKITKEIIDSGKNLKVIGRAGVGVDNIDVDAATRKGIIVVNAPDGNTISAAEHTICLLLALSRNVVKGCVSLKEYKWDRSKLIGFQLYDKVIGIIGLGRIGKMVAEYARGLKMQVIAYDPYVNENTVKQTGIKIVSLKELLSTSDYITVHVPLTSHTKYIISDKEFEMMKKTAMIINCARGGIINETALYKALKDNKILGAALDVFEKEPPTSNNPLVSLPNVIVTPHLGASTKEAQVNVSIICAKQVISALKGELLTSAVNLPAIEPEFFSKFSQYIFLSEKLGSLLGQIIDTSINSIEITYSGELSNQKTMPLTLSIIKGLLQEIIPERVSYVNAKLLADERGISIIDKVSSERMNFSNLISITTSSGKNKKRQIAGTIFNGNEPKIVLMDGVHIDADPSGYLLIISNEDKPGVVGKVGTILGDNKVNIAGIYLGRQTRGGKAISIINIDNAISDKIINEIKKIPAIKEANLVELL